MKKVKTYINNELRETKEQWSKLSVKQQRRTVLIIFAGYFSICMIVIIKACYNIETGNTPMVIEHIENPVLNNRDSSLKKMDSLSQVLKNKLYERK